MKIRRMSSSNLFSQLYKSTVQACRVVHKPKLPIARPPSYRRAPRPRKKILLAAFTGGSLITVGLVRQSRDQDRQPQPKEDQRSTSVSNLRTDTKICKFPLSVVKLHDCNSDRPWVTKGKSVYDITEWVAAHPGGEVILRAAGGSIDPYWNIFTIHKRSDVYEILEQYKIGEIEEKDLIDGQVPIQAIEDPFMSDPAPDTRLHILTARPCNAETPGKALSEFCTPNETFYVRNHMWVPIIKESDHNLVIELGDGTEKTYTMADLKKRFKQHRISATLQCAGNRRNDMTKHARQTNGLQWTVGAISTAEWEGVKLRDILADAGLDLNSLPPGAKHAQFSGLEAYGASIPIHKAVDPAGDVLLAFQMNGVSLPREHGFPLRVIVPGNVAARSVKWLSKITISDEESLTQWQRKDYKSFGPNDTKPNWESAKSIQEMPVTSAITSISNASARDGAIEKNMGLEGYAYSGGGREIVRVDVSVDGGETWDQAELLEDRTKGLKSWCWKRWRYSRERMGVGKATIMVKATDEAYNTQPESYASIYNARGNLATAWHRVEIGHTQVTNA